MSYKKRKKRFGKRTNKMSYEKYLMSNKSHTKKFEIHPTELVNLSKKIEIKSLEIVLRPMGFLDKSSIWLDEKTSMKFKKQMGTGVTLKKIYNDKAIYIVDPKKAHLNKIEKFYDKLEEFQGGFVDMEMLTFVYLYNVSPEIIDEFFLTRVNKNFTG
jgi:hypothetical protein